MIAPATTKKAEAGAAGQAASILSRFLGTSNPRHLRAVHALLAGPVLREELDRIVGTSNSPQAIARLRELGLDAPCERLTVEDRDGKTCRPGRYFLTSRDRAKLQRWLASSQGGRA